MMSRNYESTCDVQYEKHSEQRISTVRGIMTDLSDDDENAYDSIRVNRDSDSNEIDESDLQYEKHFEQRISTVRGIMIDCRDDDENADDSIRVNRESDSNEIMQTDLAMHPKLHSTPFSPGIQPHLTCDSAHSAQIRYSKQPPLTNTRRPKKRIPSSSPSLSSKPPSDSVFFQCADIPANEFEKFISR
jgi:hypothetical protein